MTDSGLVPLYTVAQVRAIDRHAIDVCGIPGAVLMARAGRRAFDVIREHWPDARHLAVYAGTGNNGGDALVVARLALDAGLAVTTYLVGDESRVSGDARRALEAFRAAGGNFSDPVGADPNADLVVDGLLGTGGAGALREPLCDAVTRINASGSPVLALDLPSGLDGDTGAASEPTVRASVTVTFVGRKLGLYTGRAPDYAGEVVFADLGLSEVPAAACPASAELLSFPAIAGVMPARTRTAHKGAAGHLLVIGGNTGMGGAAIMAAEAALRCGVGLVSLATRAGNELAAMCRRPEIMARAVVSGDELQPLLAKADAIAIGPGLGTDHWALDLMRAARLSGLPCIVDADALNILASQIMRLPPGGIITPHPGEAARLLGCEVAEIESDRPGAVRQLASRYESVALLKGAGTLVAGAAAEDPIGVCPYGNPGMATGGMGDVLTGIIGGLLAQGLSPTDAARLGACLHARAGDAAAADGQRGLLASDLMTPLRRLIPD